jgi:rRNA maturation endonuclease Nob1
MTDIIDKANEKAEELNQMSLQLRKKVPHVLKCETCKDIIPSESKIKRWCDYCKQI